uniref:nuclear transport factor 2 family protein n=1 Tax=Mycolicibacterium sp. TaxID=2320850 RepID=UPI0037C69AA4
RRITRSSELLHHATGLGHELLSDQVVYTHSFGERDDKESYLEKVRSGFFVYHEIEHPIEQLTATDEYAVIVGQMRASVTNNGELRTLNNACLAVWVREGDAWKFLAYQPTPNP